MKFRIFMTAMAVCLGLFSAPQSHAHEHKKTYEIGKLIVSGVWARTTPPTAKTGAAYFMIQNNGSTADTLIGAKGTVSDKVEIHESKIEGGIMKMSHVGKIKIPAQGMAALKPGGFHIMMIGLHQPIKEGDQFPLMLTFEKSGNVEVMVKAMKATSMKKMDHGQMPKMDRGKMGTH